MLRNIYFILIDVYNRLDYGLRQWFHWQRGTKKIVNDPKENLFDKLLPEQRQVAQDTADRLLRQYHLEHFYAHSSAENYRENLFYLALLEAALEASGVKLDKKVIAGDIGASSWFYVQALYALLKWYQAPQGRWVHLTGYERDAYRVYADFRSRYDHARTYSNGLKDVEYLPKAFVPQMNHFDILFMLFPFVFLNDHLKWGLPKKQFNPAGLLSAAWLSLKKDGVLIVVNQGLEEHQAQKQLFESSAIPIRTAFRFDSPLFHYDLERYVLVAIR